MVTKIVDNIQIKIQNIYIRYEDAFSAPNYGKFVMGLLLKEFSTYTTGADWKSIVMQLGENLTHKLAKIKDFSLFLDYETDETYSKDVMASYQEGHLPKSLNLESLFADTTNQVFMEILKNEFDSDSKAKHHYIIEKFGMEAHVKINKKPLENQLP